jgi:hypothetical protein
MRVWLIVRLGRPRPVLAFPPFLLVYNPKTRIQSILEQVCLFQCKYSFLNLFPNHLSCHLFPYHVFAYLKVDYDKGMFVYFEILKATFILHTVLAAMSISVHLQLYQFVQDTTASSELSVNAEHMDLFNTAEWGIGILIYCDVMDFADQNMVSFYFLTSLTIGLLQYALILSLRTKLAFVEDSTTFISSYALMVTGLPGNGLTNKDSLRNHFNSICHRLEGKGDKAIPSEHVAEVVMNWGSEGEGIRMLTKLHSDLECCERKERCLRARLKMIKSKLDNKEYDAESGSMAPFDSLSIAEEEAAAPDRDALDRTEQLSARTKGRWARLGKKVKAQLLSNESALASIAAEMRREGRRILDIDEEISVTPPNDTPNKWRRRQKSLNTRGTSKAFVVFYGKTESKQHRGVGPYYLRLCLIFVLSFIF